VRFYNLPQGPVYVGNRRLRVGTSILQFRQVRPTSSRHTEKFAFVSCWYWLPLLFLEFTGSFVQQPEKIGKMGRKTGYGTTVLT
jgi:hypothetical protein